MVTGKKVISKPLNLEHLGRLGVGTSRTSQHCDKPSTCVMNARMITPPHQSSALTLTLERTEYVYTFSK